MSIKDCGVLLSGMFLLASGVSAQELSVNGFLTQGFFYTDKNNIYGNSSDGSLDFREIAVNTRYRVLPQLHLAGQFMSRRAGAVDDGSPQIDYALMDYRIEDTAVAQYGLRAGRLKIPFGFYNDTRDVAFTRPSIMLPQSLYFDQARDLELSVDGVGVYAGTSLGSGRLDFDLVYGMPRKDENVEYAYLTFDASGRFADSEGMMFRSIYNSEGNRFRAGITLAEFKLGYEPLSGNSFPTDLKEFNAGDLKVNVTVLSGQYNTEKWTFTSEYMRQEIDWGELGGVFSQRPRTESESYYLQAQYRFAVNWDLIARYDVLYLDKSDRNGAANSAAFRRAEHNFFAKDLTLGVGWRPDPAWLVRAEYHYVDGTGWLPEQDNPDNSKLERYWNLFALQVTYRF
ncbi:TonB-dependent receptor [Aliamphritea ceti]|uniref:TonB-dependent receptor n=1 Tax=Aliamphritea ceti TaxID=1524258 RepID=UPI0021C349BD|nr:TonB-dependent receptor [Aliamphritea ceti]